MIVLKSNTGFLDRIASDEKTQTIIPKDIEGHNIFDS
jgi:hypothetical protein